MEVPLVDKDYLLERTPGNGGWTYAPIPEVPQDKKGTVANIRGLFL